MDKKKLGLIIIFIIITLILGYTMYRLFFYRAAQPQPEEPGVELPGGPGFPQAGEGEVTGPGAEEPGGLPTAGVIPEIEGPSIPEEEPTVSRVIDSIIDNSSAGTDGNVNFYSRQDGKFYRYDTETGIEELSDQVFYNVSNVTWSPTKNEGIIEYPDGSNIYYNFDTKKQVTLPKHWQEFDFSENGNQIVSKSMGLSPENRWLITSDPEGNGVRTIEPLGENASEVIVDWSPNRQVVALSTTGEPLGGYRQEVLFVGLNGENFPSTIVEGQGLQTEWSKDGSKLLYSVYSPRSEYKPELWVVNAQGNDIGTGRQSLNLNTWAEKCTFQDDRFVYCGVPTELPVGSGFNADSVDNVNDYLYKIDTQTGLRTQIELEGYHVIDDIFMSKDGSQLFFTDKTTDGLFSVDI
ncbi:MAG: hypothetical protein GF349_03955 [Candidatus Magasanikbacteria bacterium]|nr:hypothetical protein [Candidatus Magasanikbacteria bacterium]